VLSCTAAAPSPEVEVTVLTSQKYAVCRSTRFSRLWPIGSIGSVKSFLCPYRRQSRFHFRSRSSQDSHGDVPLFFRQGKGGGSQRRFPAERFRVYERWYQNIPALNCSPSPSMVYPSFTGRRSGTQRLSEPGCYPTGR